MNKISIYRKEKLENLDLQIKGKLKISIPSENKVLYEENNIITLTVKSLIARLMAASTEPAYGVWGLALGTGDANWSNNTQPAETSTQTALITQVLRKPLSSVAFLDGNGNPLASGSFSNVVNFTTTINATTDGILNVSLREMGLIGGGSTSGSTNMLTAPYWDPNTPAASTATLINYKTLPPLILPPGINTNFDWTLTF